MAVCLASLVDVSLKPCHLRLLYKPHRKYSEGRISVFSERETMRKQPHPHRAVLALALILISICLFSTNRSSAFVTSGFNASTVGAVGATPAIDIDVLTGQWIQTSGP